MKIGRFCISTRGRSGFTLVEILIGLAISGLLVGGIATAIWQVVNVNAGSVSRMTAIKQVEVAIDNLRPDILVAQEITPNLLQASGFPLQLGWVDWDSGAQNLVTYSVNASKALVREASVKGNSSSRVIARNIESISMQNAASYAGGQNYFNYLGLSVRV